MATGGSDSYQLNSGEDIRFLVQHVYKDLLIKHVRAGSILGKMMPPTEHQETVNNILAYETSKQYLRATREFLLYLDQLGDTREYLHFVQLLEEKDYAFLSKLLLGEDTIDPETHKEHCNLIAFFSEDIGEKVDFDKLYPRLVEDDWMDTEDRELLERLANNNGMVATSRWLVFYVLPNRKEKWLKQFLQILRDLGYDDLAAFICGEDASDSETLSWTTETESVSTLDDDQSVRMNIVQASGDAHSSYNNLDTPNLPLDQMKYVERRRFDGGGADKSNRIEQWVEKTREIPHDCQSDTISVISSVEDNALVLFDNEDEVTPELLEVREKNIQHLESRPYQEELARSASDGRNVIIIAPTGCGKTVVAVKIMQNHLEKKMGNGKIAFFANEVTLVDQQHEMCRRFLESTIETIQIVGETKDKSRIPVPDLIKLNDIVFMTPQIIVDCLSNKSLESLSIFSLMIFDECHNVNLKHPSNNIMSAYMDMKFSGVSCLPQVVGLTASVGTGKKKIGSERSGAIEHIKGLCARLDARGGPITVKENKDSLAEYEKYVETAIKRTNERVNDPFKRCVIDIMNKIEGKIVEQRAYLAGDPHEDIKPSMDKSTMAYKQWLSEMYFTKLPRITDVNIRKPLLTCVEHLKIYNKALLINEDCRGRDAMLCITNHLLMQYSHQQGPTGVENWLYDLFLEHQSRLEHESRAHVNLNPKLLLLKLEIVEKIRNDPRSKVLVLVKTRDLARALLLWMKETGDLEQLSPVIVTGCGASSDKGGMTRAEQIKAVRSFKWERSHVAIATSVAEEGMDFASCNRVIRYEYVSDEIAMVQARGRASRADDGDYCLITGNTDMANREQNNFRLEHVMNEAVEAIQTEIESNPQGFINSLQQLQEKQKMDRDIAKKQSNPVPKDPSAHRIHCYKCDTFICLSTDIRVVNEAHHMVMTPNIGSLVTEIPHKKPTEFDNIKKCSKIHCRKCSMDWGVAVIYKDTKFAVFTPKGLLFKPPQGKQYHRKSWKDTPFARQSMTEEDLLSYESSFE